VQLCTRCQPLNHGASAAQSTQILQKSPCIARRSGTHKVQSALFGRRTGAYQRQMSALLLGTSACLEPTKPT
jgi:hypothetical protein